MGRYVVTGGTKGIGAKAVEILRSQDHEVITVARENADINADLGTNEGRESVLAEIIKNCGDGLDGLICNAGIAGLSIHKSSYVLSVNYFGTVAVAEGLYGLLKIRKGNCAVTVSGSLAYSNRGRYFVDALLNNCGDEARIGRLVDAFPTDETRFAIYVSTKIALARWVRRVSPSWAAHGVNINALAPGPVDTTIMGDSMKPGGGLFFHPLPTLHGQNRVMEPIEAADPLVFLVSPGAKGMSGAILFCDAGTEAILSTEKFY